MQEEKTYQDFVKIYEQNHINKKLDESIRSTSKFLDVLSESDVIGEETLNNIHRLIQETFDNIKKILIKEKIYIID